jgi:hypothetical protein
VTDREDMITLEAAWIEDLREVLVESVVFLLARKLKLKNVSVCSNKLLTIVK